MSEPVLRTAPAGGVLFRIKSNPTAGDLSVLMLHGWSGDENVMWVLETVLPQTRLLVAPRGLYPIKSGGFQWSAGSGSLESSFADFRAGADAVDAVIDDLVQRDQLDLEQLVLMGFSQGAALSFAIARMADFRPRALICLAGFVPKGETDKLSGIPVFWGHGNRDELVPIERARRDLERLQASGADVTYCEADVGHRLGIECTRGLKRWLEQLDDVKPG
jgi:phospholipase/carboxylesterase